ncbi:MAG: DNA-directed RNA polymerase subunit omega [Coprothermobacterota bacterium]|nr:DNA-directed RNA polymerase subunit omega [Coprothermobacterota bacterium]
MMTPPLELLLEEMRENKYRLVVAAAKEAHRLSKRQSSRAGHPLSSALTSIHEGKVEVLEPGE